MSTDWHIHCVDCKATHHFDDANHREPLMLALCRHAEAIATLADLFADTDAFDVELRTMNGRIDPTWFREHLGHQLLPIDEYGTLIGQCWKYVDCGHCRQRQHCGLPRDHEGACAVEAPSNRRAGDQ